MIRPPLLAALVVVLLVAGACSDSSGDGGEEGALSVGWEQQVIDLAAPHRDIGFDDVERASDELCRQMIGLAGTVDFDAETTRNGAVGLFITTNGSPEEALAMAKIGDVIGENRCRDGWLTLVGGLFADSLEGFVRDALSLEDDFGSS